MNDEYKMLPVKGCDECEFIVSVVGIEYATACDECVEHQTGDIVDVNHGPGWSKE
jgi:hypothetical protein